MTDGIAQVRPHGIVTKDGTERAVDAIVLATGFEAAEQVAPFEVRGRDGRELNEAWRDGAEAYLGTTIAGFPNLFLLIGPNTGLGHSSMIFMIESQVAYVLDAIRTMRARGLKLVDLSPEAQQRLQRADPDGSHGVVERLHELVPELRGPQPDAMARVGRRVPPRDPQAGPGRVSRHPRGGGPGSGILVRERKIQATCG